MRDQFKQCASSAEIFRLHVKIRVKEENHFNRMLFTNFALKAASLNHDHQIDWQILESCDVRLKALHLDASNESLSR